MALNPQYAAIAARRSSEQADFPHMYVHTVNQSNSPRSILLTMPDGSVLLGVSEKALREAEIMAKLPAWSGSTPAATTPEFSLFATTAETIPIGLQAIQGVPHDVSVALLSPAAHSAVVTALLAAGDVHDLRAMGYDLDEAGYLLLPVEAEESTPRQRVHVPSFLRLQQQAFARAQAAARRQALLLSNAGLGEIDRVSSEDTRLIRRNLRKSRMWARVTAACSLGIVILAIFRVFASDPPAAAGLLAMFGYFGARHAYLPSLLVYFLLLNVSLAMCVYVTAGLVIHGVESCPETCRVVTHLGGRLALLVIGITGTISIISIVLTMRLLSLLWRLRRAGWDHTQGEFMSQPDVTHAQIARAVVRRAEQARVRQERERERFRVVSTSASLGQNIVPHAGPEVQMADLTDRSHVNGRNSRASQQVRGAAASGERRRSVSHERLSRSVRVHGPGQNPRQMAQADTADISQTSYGATVVRMGAGPGLSEGMGTGALPVSSRDGGTGDIRTVTYVRTDILHNNPAVVPAPLVSTGIIGGMGNADAGVTSNPIHGRHARLQTNRQAAAEAGAAVGLGVSIATIF